MYKQNFNLRNVASIVACLAVSRESKMLKEKSLEKSPVDLNKIARLFKKLSLIVTAAIVLAGCKKDAPVEEPVKQDVRIGWSLTGDFESNRCDGTKNASAVVLSEKRIDSIKALPTTKDIYAYVSCDDGRGPPAVIVTALVKRLTNLLEKGVKYEKGTLYVNDFLKQDSITAQKELKLTIDFWSRKH